MSNPSPLVSKKQLQFIQKVTDITPSLITVYSIHTGKYVFINKAVKPMLGYSRLEWMEKGIGFIIPKVHPDDLVRITAENERALKTANDPKSRQKNPVLHFEYRVKHANGSWIWLHTYGTVFDRDIHGKVQHVLNVSLDITTIKESEERILKTEHQLKELNTELEEKISRRTQTLSFLLDASRLLSSSLDYTTTLQNIVRSAVPEFADWCALDILQAEGYKRLLVHHKNPAKQKYAQKLQNDYPLDITSPGGAGKVLRTGEAEYHKIVSDEDGFKIARKNSKLFALLKKLGLGSIIIMPLKGRGRVLGAISFVTENQRRSYDEESFVMAEELARRAAAAMENARLYKESQDTIKLRDEFLSIASHELKTPITSMKMFAQVLQKQFEEKKEEEPLRYLRRINEQINKQTQFISDLLDISRLQLGKFGFKPERFDLENAIREITEGIQLTTQKHKISIRGEATKKVFADKERIGQVITNLLTNAIKYSPKGGKIIVGISQKKGGTTVSIQDEGVGIAKENLKKIFERFYQVSEPTEKTYPGLGIGLYISTEILKKHHGTLSVESTKGKGSTFTFTLPAK